MGQSVELFDDGQFDGRIALPLLDQFGQFVQDSALHLELTQGTSFPTLERTETSQILEREGSINWRLDSNSLTKASKNPNAS